uniref:Putative ovule protein n=1 Tax=Solanum chacoense TaxID=4108 RepID=A0A0V0GGB2_SOLCH
MGQHHTLALTGSCLGFPHTSHTFILALLSNVQMEQRQMPTLTNSCFVFVSGALPFFSAYSYPSS